MKTKGRKLTIQPKRSSSSVNAGTLSDTAAVVKKTFDTLLKGIDNFLDIKGWKSTKEEEITEKIDGEETKGIRKYFDTGKGFKVAVDIFPNPDDEDSVCMRAQVEGNKSLKKEWKSIKKSSINKEITAWMDKNDLGSNEGEVESSTRVLVKLQRVVGSKEDTINMLAINANCSIVLANDIVDEVLDSDDFVAQIGEDPQTYEIVETEDGQEYDVNPTDEEVKSDDVATYSEMFKEAVRLYSDLQSIHWGAKGLKFMDLHNQIDSLIWTSQNFIDVIAELMVEKTKIIPHVALYYDTQYTKEIENFIKDGFDFTTGLTYARTRLQDFIRVLESSYVNLDHDVQSTVDDWIRDLKKQSDYFMDRQLLDTDTNMSEHGSEPIPLN